MPTRFDIGLTQIYDIYPDKDKVDKKTFKAIATEFNTEVMRQVIEENKVFNIPHHLGLFKAIEKKRRFKKGKINGNYYSSIHHHKSKLKKQEILDRGGTPLEVYKDEKGKILGDNGGEPWLVYNMSDTTWTFLWSKFKKEKGYFHFNINKFTLKIARGAVLNLTKTKKTGE